MENKIFCQSCGMPMSKDADFGTNAGGSKNDDYCVYCYKNGKFTEDVTMDGMIEHCLKYLEEFKKDGNVGQDMTEEKAKNEMRAYFPTLKRWKPALPA